MPFTERTFSFLAENMFTDSRQWFHEHKDEYNEFVLEPMAELFKAIMPEMLRIDPEFTCIPAVGKSISRLWRDTRRMKPGDAIYRDNIWFTFQREKHMGLPGYHFSISPMGCEWGCGWYWTGAETMRRIRERALSGGNDWLAADEALNKLTNMSIHGECYKKSPYADSPARQRQWLDRRNICVWTEKPDAEIMLSPGLTDKLTEDFVTMEPIYRFFLTSVEHREKK